MNAREEQARAAEMSVLAAAMMEEEAAKAAAAGLAPDDFAFPENRALFEAARALVAQGQAVDFLSLHERAQGSPELRAAGGMQYLLGLNAYLPSAALAGRNIEAVRENGRERRVAREAARVIAGGGDCLRGLEMLAERERARMAPPGDGLRTMRQIAAFAESLAGQDGGRRIPTGIRGLDSILGGLERGCVSCLAARPSAGKTALALNWFVSAIRAGHKSAFFSLEMSEGKILGRLACIVSGADNAAVNRGRVTLREANALAEDLVTLAGGGRLLLYDDARSVSAIRAAIAGERPEIAFVDFLQFVAEETRAENENYRLASIVREFKRLARAYDCHVCFLSQVGRSGDGRQPSLRDLYGSGAIEQGSDTILLLDRPHVYDRSQPPSLARLLVGKNKDGECGRVELAFDGARQRFREA